MSRCIDKKEAPDSILLGKDMIQNKFKQTKNPICNCDSPASRLDLIFYSTQL